MRRYAITDRSLFGPPDDGQLSALVHQTALWAAEGIDYIQLREKDLPPAVLVRVARQILETLRDSPAKLLINSRLDVAVATGVHGVHLTSAPGELTPEQVREVYANAGLRRPIVSVSCHELAEVEKIRDEVDLILFAPVFQKAVGGEVVTPGVGVEGLRSACATAGSTPVYALGGVSWENAEACLEAGAAGIAGIRLFRSR